jgi:hypothetical protein
VLERWWSPLLKPPLLKPLVFQQKTTDMSLKSKCHRNPSQTFMAMCQNRPKEHLSGGCWVEVRIEDFEAFLSHWLEIKKAAIPVGQSRRGDFRKKLRPLIGPDLR